VKNLEPKNKNLEGYGILKKKKITGLVKRLYLISEDNRVYSTVSSTLPLNTPMLCTS